MSVLDRAIDVLLAELTEGPPGDTAFIVNPGDAGLLRSLDALTAAEASVAPAGGGAPICAHVDHLRYGISLLNRWRRGEDPFGSAEYAASWRLTSVSDLEWRALRDALREELVSWRGALRDLDRLGDLELEGVISSVVHLAYHFGAIRQINRGLRGPRARD